jgi:hypothetical protein
MKLERSVNSQAATILGRVGVPVTHFSLPRPLLGATCLSGMDGPL